ncbi:MAG: hypothetical protein ACI8VW_002834, partial [bacterium]
RPFEVNYDVRRAISTKLKLAEETLASHLKGNSNFIDSFAPTAVYQNNDV